MIERRPLQKREVLEKQRCHLPADAAPGSCRVGESTDIEKLGEHEPTVLPEHSNEQTTATWARRQCTETICTRLLGESSGPVPERLGRIGQQLRIAAVTEIVPERETLTGVATIETGTGTRRGGATGTDTEPRLRGVAEEEAARKQQSPTGRAGTQIVGSEDVRRRDGGFEGLHAQHREQRQLSGQGAGISA